ncbi:cysteine--tRNA ligase [Parasphingopyxis lamellibrachiae]|uniref:Cysteine--tRNA ligase n=1 Tax=Parasphingopyxis lamellibrachiae TaxID=680125 RepID=A0A3D9FDE2_9SPHN|nr:cysteine--tRNA ligase [Parasphingopyxis lamellibrachiae]RED15773.1 cysteinyl-tRNA synthetase [Parasphingopyxis lamellibrachiae]
MTESHSAPLTLFNSLTRQAEPFVPVHPGEARVYTCGPTVYNFQHIGNMRAYIFADTLGRVLSWKGYKLTHIINITDVGHLTSDADAGDDKMEKAASAAGKSAWDIAKFYTDAYWRDIERLNIRQPAKWSIATEHVEAMIDFAKSIADKHCYELESGLYFDTSTVPGYGSLARANTDDGESRIDPVEGKRHATDFAIWRKTPAGETRQMEWDSPWGKGAPGWHLECSVMSKMYLGETFDIHTGGIDHREIHHPNEIAQNQAHSCSADTGANIWMHNNFLVDRGGKMSKSAGEFLTLQWLVDRGVHPLAYRLMCLQAHYRSELEFTFDNLLAALTRIKRMVMAVEQLKAQTEPADRCTHPRLRERLDAFDAAVSDDLNTPKALTHLDEILAHKKIDRGEKLAAVSEADAVLGLNLLTLNRTDLRIRPTDAEIDETEIERQLDLRRDAKASKNFPAADAIRDDLAARGVEIMDGDPLRWDWRITA